MSIPSTADSPVLQNDVDVTAAGLQSGDRLQGLSVNCLHCEYPLECVEQNRRSGSWLGSLICANCRSEYFYAYRWGRLMRKA